MLEIIYRIYEVLDCENPQSTTSNNNVEIVPCSIDADYRREILMDCVVCDSRDHFKSIMRDRFGEKLTFRYSNKLKPGDLYCIIIGEHCFNTERYFNKIEYVCSECGAKVTTFLNSGNIISMSDHDIKYRFLGNSISSSGIPYSELKFCSNKCLTRYIDAEVSKIKHAGEGEFFVTRDAFTQNNTNGYVYKITKKSSGEFYVGQTQYVPMFRWAQHLKTPRFDIASLTDYEFEVIEIVPKGQNLLDRETYWIQECYRQNPEKSLNISQTGEVKKEILAKNNNNINCEAI